VVYNGLKLIVDVPSGAVRLYDLRRDPNERNDVSEDRADDAAHLHALIDAQRVDIEADGTGAAGDHEATERQLRALGYLE
jgi:arylsulfatase A-like enzyme